MKELLRECKEEGNLEPAAKWVYVVISGANCWLITVPTRWKQVENI